MNAFFLYIIQSALCFSLMFGLYMLLLRRETFFRFKRNVLLSIIISSLVIPMIHIPVAEPAFVQTPILQLEEVFFQTQTVSTIVPETEISEIQIITTPKSIKINPVLLVYFVGFFISLAISLISFICVARIVLTARSVVYGQRKILVSPMKISSFTFAGWIVLSEMDYERFAEEVIAHETIHLHCGHFWDLCLISVITVIHWFNPLSWFLQREMKALHEYEADRLTLITTGINATQYKLLLIEKVAGASSYSIASNFAQTNIKNRITMMTRQNQKPWARWKALLFIPMAALLMQAFARPEINREIEQISTVKGTEFLQENNEWTEEKFLEEFRKTIPENTYGSMNHNDTLSKNVNDAQQTDVIGWQLVSVVVKQKKDDNDQYPCIIHSTSPDVKYKAEYFMKDFSEEEIEKVNKGMEICTEQQILYNGQMTKIKDVSELLKEKTNEKVYISYQFCYDPQTKKGKCCVRISLPEIDPKDPAFFYFLNGKWIYGRHFFMDDIKSIDVYAPDEALKKYGNKAKNGAIAIVTK